MQSLDALNLIPVWVNPEHLAATARIILAGHRLKVLGVIEGAELVGVVTEAQVRNEANDVKVRDIMQKAEFVVDVSTPLRQLAETFWKEDLDFIPVLEGDRFCGVATPNMLLREMARSWDPLTGLSWSDRLREWGVENLKHGREITILFIDLDEFGSYNKKYGHIVGDRVLQRVADMIEERTDRTRDLLVRYGGDEFAVGTIRDQGEALELARSLHEGMSRIRVSGSDEPVTFSIGIQGGKRTKERENVHYAATLDNLINLASKNSMAEKTAKMARLPADPLAEAVLTERISGETASILADVLAQPENDSESPVASSPAADDDSKAEEALRGPLRVDSVMAEAADANSVTNVTIRAGDRLFSGVCPRKGGSVLRSVALATIEAVSFVDPTAKLEVRDVYMTESENGVRFISVTGSAQVNGKDQPIGGVGTVGRDLYFTIAEATLQAYTNFESLRGETTPRA